MRGRVVMVFVMLGAALALVFPAAAQGQGGVQHGSLIHDGVERTWLAYIPGGADGAQPLPLVFALHGGVANGTMMMAGTGFNALAEQENFIVVYPDALGRGDTGAWNTGMTAAAQRGRGADDVGFISAIIDALSQRYAIDPSRIFATGGSNGGMMAFRLACELSSRVSAVVTAVANMPEWLAASCDPGRPVPILMMMSTTDPRMPFEGGNILNLRGDVISAQDTVSFWLNNNGCSAQSVDEQLPDLDPQDGTIVTARRFVGCQSPVEWFVMAGGGHGWPGRPQYNSAETVGVTVQDIDATQVAWEFFSRVAGG